MQRRHGLASPPASSLDALGYTSAEEGDFARAGALYGESFDLHNRLGNRAGVALGLINFAEIAYAQGKFDQAERLFGPERRRRPGHRRSQSPPVLDAQHRRHRLQRGRYAEAQRLFEEGLTISQRQNTFSGQVATLAKLARLAIIDRRMDRGEEYLRQALALAERTAVQTGLALVGDGAAHWASERGEPARAAALCAAADTLFAALRVKRAAPDQARQEALVRSLRTALPPKQFDSAWQYGQRATVAEAMDRTPPPPAANHQAAADPAGLSERERDVLRLLAQGMTNAEAANALGLSLFTVKAHIRSIYSKLGVNTRTAAARYAHDNHLI